MALRVDRDEVRRLAAAGSHVVDVSIVVYCNDYTLAAPETFPFAV